jgi:hypothetical protein
MKKPMPGAILTICLLTLIFPTASAAPGDADKLIEADHALKTNESHLSSQICLRLRFFQRWNA